MEWGLPVLDGGCPQLFSLVPFTPDMFREHLTRVNSSFTRYAGGRGEERRLEQQGLPQILVQNGQAMGQGGKRLGACRLEWTQKSNQACNS